MNGGNLLGLAKSTASKKQQDAKGQKENSKGSSSATLSTHYQCLDKGASVDEHEERFELVSKRIEHNLKASEQVRSLPRKLALYPEVYPSPWLTPLSPPTPQLRTYMLSPRRNKLLKSPRASRPVRNMSQQRALNLSPAIATILPHNSKSQSQQNDYQDGSKNLLTVHGLVTNPKLRTPRHSPTTIQSPTTVPLTHPGLFSPV